MTVVGYWILCLLEGIGLYHVLMWFWKLYSFLQLPCFLSKKCKTQPENMKPALFVCYLDNLCEPHSVSTMMFRFASPAVDYRELQEESHPRIPFRMIEFQFSFLDSSKRQVILHGHWSLEFPRQFANVQWHYRDLIRIRTGKGRIYDGRPFITGSTGTSSFGFTDFGYCLSCPDKCEFSYQRVHFPSNTPYTSKCGHPSQCDICLAHKQECDICRRVYGSCTRTIHS